jgi:phosphoglycolate phosphatase
VPEPISFIDESPLAAEILGKAEILYTDLDGTLLGRGGCLLADHTGAPSLVAANAITRLNATGLPVVVCSGRNSKQLMELTRLVGWRDFMAELGSVRSYNRSERKVYDTGDWPPGVLLKGETPYDAIVRAGAVDLLEQEYPGFIEYHDPWHLDREVTHVLRGNVPLGEAQTLLDRIPLHIDLIDNGIIHPPKHTLREGIEIHAYHLVPRGVSKANAIAADLAERGFTPDQAIAVGDSAEDVGMAESVGLMVVVNNGLDDPVLVERASGQPYVVATRGRQGHGWRELADAWLAARGEA